MAVAMTFQAEWANAFIHAGVARPDVEVYRPPIALMMSLIVACEKTWVLMFVV